MRSCSLTYSFTHICIWDSHLVFHYLLPLESTHRSVWLFLDVLICGGCVTVKSPGASFIKGVYLKEDTWKSYLYDVILVHRNVARAKAVAVQRRKCLGDSRSQILLLLTVCEPRRAVGDTSSWRFDGDTDLLHFIFKQLSFFYHYLPSSHKVCCVCPLNPVSLFFSREEISRVIIYKAV